MSRRKVHFSRHLCGMTQCHVRGGQWTHNPEHVTCTLCRRGHLSAPTTEELYRTWRSCCRAHGCADPRPDHVKLADEIRGIRASLSLGSGLEEPFEGKLDKAGRRMARLESPHHEELRPAFDRMLEIATVARALEAEFRELGAGMEAYAELVGSSGSYGEDLLQ